MKRWLRLIVVLIIGSFLIGCGAAGRLIDYGSMKTDVAISESVFLSPTDASKTILVQIRNTSTNQNITSLFESTVISGIQSRGYQIVQKPSQATYILQANIRYLGEWKAGMNFEGTLTGAGLGALAGLGLSDYHHRGSGMAIGALAGSVLGFVADVATRVQTEIIVVDFQITERLTKEQDILGKEVEETRFTSDTKTLGGFGTRPDFPTSQMSSKTVRSAKKGTRIYSGAVAARAAQVNLDVNEATIRLIETSGRQIAGIF